MRQKRSRGFTLIEVLVALIIATALLAGIAGAVRTYGDRLANISAASHAGVVSRAARSYLQANHTSLLASAGPTSPATITPAMLAPYLPQGFITTNGFGQTYTIKVIQPVPGQLDAIAMTVGGDTISPLNLRHIAQLIGAEGGYVSAGTTAVGAYDGWSRSLTPFGGSPGAGKIAIALFFLDAAAKDGYLHRDQVAGSPEFTRMATSVDMAGHDLAAAAAVDANALQLASGNSLSIGSVHYYGDLSNAAIRQAGGLYVQTPSGQPAPINQVGSITSQGDLTTTASISAGGNASAANVRAGESYSNGWFRTQGNGGWYSASHGGGWYMTDPTWIRAYNGKSVYSSGQLYAATASSTGGITADQSLSAAQTIVAGNDITAGRNITAAGNVAASASINATGSIAAGGRISAGEFLLPQGIGVCNAPCSSNGLIARTASGAMLSCTGGVWRGYSCP